MRERRIVNFVIVAALAMVPAVAMANGPAVDLSPSQLMLKSNNTQVEWVLTVVGPDDFYFNQVFAKGETPSFSVSVKMPDGSYTYELTAQWQPGAEIAEVLALARETGDYSKVDQLRLEGRIPEPIEAVSGYFMLSGGSIITGEATEEIGKPRTQTVATAKDQVILDDLIVDGSLCVGFDCVNGENFGFDTIRMKENNIRIKAQDTSTSASFPSNDWQITFNDSSNGGANKFSIDDIDGGRTPFTIEASAPSHSLYVDDGGRIGMGTSTPVVQLHVKDGNTPTLRLEQDGSSGFTPQTWDVAGNEANFFIRDATSGSTLPFRIFPGAPSNALNIAASGYVGVGTNSPSGLLHVRSTGNVLPVFESSDNNAVQFRIKSGSTNRRFIALDGSDNQESQINFGDNGSFDFWGPTASDTRMSIASNGNVTITGTLVTGGGGTCDPGPCDATFTDYQLESIEEHAAYMWENHHLWGVGPTPDGEPINLSKKTTGILHELEKAHIYIEQLHLQLKQEKQERQDLEQRLHAIEEMLAESTK